MAIDKEKSMLKPSKNDFGLHRANFSVFKDQNSRGISFQLAEISGKLFFYPKMTIGKEKGIPWPLKTNFCPIEAILSCLRVEAQRKFIYNWIEFSSNYFLPWFDNKKLVLSLQRSILAQFRAIFGLLNRPKLSL